MNPTELKKHLADESERLGFCAFGVAPAGAVEYGERFRNWLSWGYHAEMGFLEKRLPERLDTRTLFPGAASVIALAMNYRTPRPAPPDDGKVYGRTASYAWGRDYHKIVTGRLKALKRKLEEQAPHARVYYEVDTGPVLERAWAQRAGLGWIGKSGNLIVPGCGSMVVLGILITDLFLPADSPMPNRCGNCTRCMEVCPMGAIVEPGLVDSRKCLSYWTIEHRGEIPEEVRKNLRDRVFGCETCQEVCPFNAVESRSPEPEFEARPGMAWIHLEWLLNLSESEYDTAFEGSVMRRAGLEGLKRNARGAMENMRE